MLHLLGYFIEDGEIPNLVSEWMENGTLTNYLKHLSKGVEAVLMVRPTRNIRMDGCVLIGFVKAIGIAEGLNHLHSLGIIHADLKSVCSAFISFKMSG